MKKDTLEYIKARANDEGSIKAVSCADVRDLLAERAELLEALKLIEASASATFHNNSKLADEIEKAYSMDEPRNRVMVFALRMV